MKEVVLPASGDFAQMRALKWSELRQVLQANKGDVLTAMIAATVTIDGQPVDERRLDAMDLRDAMVISKMVSDVFSPVGEAKGVA